MTSSLMETVSARHQLQFVYILFRTAVVCSTSILTRFWNVSMLLVVTERRIQSLTQWQWVTAVDCREKPPPWPTTERGFLSPSLLCCDCQKCFSLQATTADRQSGSLQRTFKHSTAPENFKLPAFHWSSSEHSTGSAFDSGRSKGDRNFVVKCELCWFFPL